MIDLKILPFIKGQKKVSLQIKSLFALAVFLFVMLVLTFVSRYAADFITARVTTTSPKPMYINDDAYESCVPLTVLHQEGIKMYIFIVSQKDTVLGIKTEAERVNVTVVDENKNYAAIKGGFANNQDIIMSSNKPVVSGDYIFVK
jgi:hypothetical protein